MCKNSSYLGIGKTEGIVVFSVIVVIVFAILFLQKAMEPKIPEVSKMRSEIKTLTNVTASDSTQITSYAQRLDSMQNELNSIRDQYQMDINIGIDRLNSWIGFWLAILALVLLLSSVWQYMQVKRHDDEWGKLKSEFEDLNKENGKTLKKLEESKTRLVERFQIENSIFNLLRTMSAIQDPMMLMPSAERKQNISEFLGNFQQQMKRYKRIVLADESNKDFNTDECLTIRLIFTNLIVNLCRCSTLYTSPSASLAIRGFLDFIKKQEESIRFQRTLEKKYFDDFLEQFGKLKKGLNFG